MFEINSKPVCLSASSPTSRVGRKMDRQDVERPPLSISPIPRVALWFFSAEPFLPPPPQSRTDEIGVEKVPVYFHCG